jgi:hypothetical protein
MFSDHGGSEDPLVRILNLMDAVKNGDSQDGTAVMRPIPQLDGLFGSVKFVAHSLRHLRWFFALKSGNCAVRHA